MTFKDINLSDKLINGLEKQNITQPTPIQIHSYKHIMNKKDLIACSSTGSGKTLAYLLPVISQLIPDSKYIQALILVPTQELAIQVCKQIDILCKNSELPYSSLFLIGNGIGPGYIETPQTAPLRERQPDGSRHPFDSFIVAKTPAERWLKPEELAGPAVFLASEASDAVNGHILYVDGGILAYIGKQPQ